MGIKILNIQFTKKKKLSRSSIHVTILETLPHSSDKHEILHPSNPSRGRSNIRCQYSCQILNSDRLFRWTRNCSYIRVILGQWWPTPHRRVVSSRKETCNVCKLSRIGYDRYTRIDKILSDTPEVKPYIKILALKLYASAKLKPSPHWTNVRQKCT